MQYTHSHMHQKGLSLVEIMIALTLGLLLMTGVVQIFLANKQTFTMADNVSRLEENGRYALNVIAQHLRMGGYADPTKSSTPQPFYAQCGSNAANCISRSWGCTEEDACTTNGNNNESDRLSVWYEPLNTLAGGEDCTGAQVNGRVINVFWVEEDATNNNVSTLFCRGYSHNNGSWISDPLAIAPGVDNLQVLYGEIIGANATSPTRYVDASQVSNWGRVKTVRVGLLVQAAAQSGRTQTAQQNYAVLDVGGLTFNDRQLRTLYTTTISLNNVIP